ncbi:MAG: hypothetical protein JWN94_4647 [Betaproteobacteria bacterium]|nr:hypothetical protein [Betaproteobacteria bacterium]
MRTSVLKWLTPAIAIAAASTAHAGPMGFKDSWMTMGDLGPNWQEVWVNYAVTPRDAFGAGLVQMRSDDGTKRRELSEVTYTRLLNRWNAKEAQANVWLVGGIGAVQGNDFKGSKVAVTPGIQFDFETTRIYFATTGQLYRAPGLNHDYASVRAGFSFYEVDYEQTQPWLIVEARRMRDLAEKAEITPMLRLIDKGYFVEGGVNNSHQLRFNFMYIF